MYLRVLSAGIIVLGVGLAHEIARGQTPPPAAIAPAPAAFDMAAATPSDPVAKAAFQVLDKHCSRCHQDGLLRGKLKPSKDFGNVLKLNELAETPHYVVPGNSDASLLFNVIATGKMPYDVYQEFDTAHPEPTPDEIKALKTWIESVVARCETRKVVRNADIVSTMAADLKDQKPHRVRGTRYLVLSQMHNACVKDDLLDAYRDASVKLLNSLSARSDIVRLETVDPERTILRFNLDDLGWSEADWNLVLSRYPYGAKPDNPLFSFLQSATGTALPYLRADWFAFEASKPPLYHTLLKLPDTLGGLERKLGLDLQADIDRLQAPRAGFQKSGVSANNRLIERHTISTGYFWTSYDFAGNRAKQNLFAFPLGPHGEAGFDHDGGESLFSLPNGFQGYYLSNAKGTQLDIGPTAIVRDSSRRDLAVTNGISCFGCHDAGIRKARDDVRQQALADRSFSKAVRDKVEALYPTGDVMEAIQTQDAGRFREAMIRAGLIVSASAGRPGREAAKPHGNEMINDLSKHYEEVLDLKTMAAEFGQTPDEFKQAAIAAGGKALALARRVEQGLVPRDGFETDFASLVSDINDEAPLDLKGGAASAGPARASGETGLVSGFDLSLTSDKTAYRQNDNAVLTVLSQRACNLTIIDVDGSGIGTILFPNEFQKNNRIEANRALVIGDGSAFKFKLADKGTETVIAECNASKAAARGFEADYKAGGFTDIGNYEQRLTRRIVVEAAARRETTRRIQIQGTGAAGAGAATTGAADTKPATGVPGAVTSTAPAPPEIVSRTAIKLEVR